MAHPRQMYYNKRGEILVKNLKSRHFDAYYCENKDAALVKALELIPEGASVAWGGATSAQEIGLMDAVQSGNYRHIDRYSGTEEQRLQATKDGMFADVFLCGANALSLDGQMVNIDGTGNRLAAICYGPGMVLVVAGMNKVEDTLDAAINRARTVAAPINKQRFPATQTPCMVTGICADCKAEGAVCNQILVTRHCRPVGRIKFIIVGEDLGY